MTFTVANNSTRLQSTMNTLFFVCLFLDVLGGCFAYVGVIHFQRISEVIVRWITKASAITEILDRQDGINNPNPTGDGSDLHSNMTIICRHLRSSEDILFRGSDDLRVWNEITEYLQHSVDGVTVEDILSHTFRLEDESRGLREQLLMHLQQYKSATIELSQLELVVCLAFSTSMAAPAVYIRWCFVFSDWAAVFREGYAACWCLNNIICCSWRGIVTFCCTSHTRILVSLISPIFPFILLSLCRPWLLNLATAH